MGGETTLTLSLIIALVGCFIGLGGWLSGRDKRIFNDAQWRGKIDAKLDTVIGFGVEMQKLTTDLSECNKELALIKQSNTSLHQRLDNHIENHT